MSASISKVVRCAITPSAAAKFADSVLLPTPPFGANRAG
jgi:hypothetical protein